MFLHIDITDNSTKQVDMTLASNSPGQMVIVRIKSVTVGSIGKVRVMGKESSIMGHVWMFVSDGNEWILISEHD